MQLELEELEPCVASPSSKLKLALLQHKLARQVLPCRSPLQQTLGSLPGRSLKSIVAEPCQEAISDT